MHCYGHYYKFSLPDGRFLRCRSVLEITRHNYEDPEDPNVLLNQQPDAVVVMMNPGSSRPEGEEEQPIRNPGNIRTRCQLVKAIPDNTQGQIMKIMRCMDYGHIRVLNLSDIREPNSGQFFRTIRQRTAIQNGYIRAPHSIFSQCRSEELQYRMNPHSQIVIAGWGKSWNKSQWKNNFAAKCYDMIRGFGFRIIGYQDDDSNDHIFTHPYYKSIMNNWPDCIISQIRAGLRNRNIER